MTVVRMANQLEDIRALLASEGDVSIAVAYVTKAGWGLVEDAIRVQLDRGFKIRMVIDLHSGITEPEVLRRMHELSKDEDNGFQFRAFFNKGPLFHAKLFLAQTTDSTTFITGSPNLTRKALTENLEHSVWIQCKNQEVAGKQAAARFEEFWCSDGAKVLTERDLQKYQESYLSSLRKLTNPELWAESREFHEEGHWLFKCQPERYAFSFSTLLSLAKDGEATAWGEEVAGGLAGRYLRVEVRRGDLLLFYHSGEKWRKVMGTAQVVSDPYPSKISKRWLVDIKAVEEFIHPVTLNEIKDSELRPQLADLALDISKRQKQVSIQRLTKLEYDEIIRLGAIQDLESRGSSQF